MFSEKTFIGLGLIAVASAGTLALATPRVAPTAPRSIQSPAASRHADDVLRQAFDSDLCLQSCDRQYSDCERRGNDNSYSSGQLEQCRKGCLEHG
jgi:hypothetical protein